MRTISRHAVANGARLAGASLAAAALVAACSSSAKKSGSSSSAAAGGGGSSAAAVMVETHSGPMGTFLTDSSGHSLYMFASDSATKSTCNEGCATFWPPLRASGTPAVSGEAKSNLISTITRSDGSKQLAYDGHPLYTYKEDTSAGQTNGQGSNNFGAKWWLMAPSGQPITSTRGASSSSSSSSSAGGGGGGWS